MERRARRSDAPNAPVEPRQATHANSAGISWTGAIGAGLGFAIMIALAIVWGVGAGDDPRLYAIPLAASSSIFAFGFYVSIRPLKSRESPLRGVVVASLLLAVLGAVVVDIGLPVVLAPPIVLLAQAAGLIFQRNR